MNLFDESIATTLLDSMNLAFRQVLNTEQRPSFDVLYRHAYTLVLRGRGEHLYNALKTCLQEHVRSRVVPLLTDSEADALFGDLRRERLEFAQKCVIIRDIVMYMDRVYVEQAGLRPVKELAAHVFQQEVSMHANLGVKLRSLLIEPFLRGIDGEDVDWKSWNDSCKLLLELSDDSRQLYEEQFEVPLLGAVTEHYRVKLRKLLADQNASHFELILKAFMENETLYLENVEDKTTKQWLRSVLDNVVTEANNVNK